MRLATVVLVILLLTLSVVPALAARPLRVEIEVRATISPGAIDAFDASGPAVVAGLVCPSGDSSNANINVKNPESTTIKYMRVLKLFECEGSGEKFYIALEVRLDVASGNTTGKWKFLGGTGNYTNLRGSGLLVGTPDGDGFILDVYTGRLQESSGAEPACADDVFEPNNSYVSAFSLGSLADGGSFVGSGSLCADDDWYEFEVLDTVNCVLDELSVSVTLSFNHSDGDLALQLWSAGRQLLDSSNTATDLEEVSTVWLGAGSGTDDSRDLYVRVSGIQGVQNDYQLMVGPVTERCYP